MDGSVSVRETFGHLQYDWSRRRFEFSTSCSKETICGVPSSMGLNAHAVASDDKITTFAVGFSHAALTGTK
jgi:hypothetical protein